MRAQVRVLAVATALTLGGWMTTAGAQGCSTAASACGDSATSVVNVSNTSAAEAKASCGDTATSVVNVSNEKKSDCATTCGDSATSIVNVANEKKSDCATTCGDSAAQYVRVADERTNGYGGAGEVAQRHYGLGDTISDFTLLHAQSGEQQSLSDLAGETATVLIFWNQSCPWVYDSPRACHDDVVDFASKYSEHGISTILIDAGIENSIEQIKSYAQDTNLTVPLLINRDSSLAAKFRASYTPESFILNSDMELVYSGAYHVMRGDNWHNTTADAVDDLIAGQTPAVQQARGRGCTIKWAPGSRPSN